MTYDPTDLRAQQNEKQEAAARKRVERDNEIADLKWLMSSKRGRSFMWRVLTLSGPFRLSFDINAMRMAFNEGGRSLGNRLWDEVMTHCPEMYPVMFREQRELQHGNRDGNGNQSN